MSALYIFRCPVQTFDYQALCLHTSASYLYRRFGDGLLFAGKWVGVKSSGIAVLEGAEVLPSARFEQQHPGLVIVEDFTSGFQATHLVSCLGHVEPVLFDEDTGVIYTVEEWEAPATPATRWRYDADSDLVLAPDGSEARLIVLEPRTPPTLC